MWLVDNMATKKTVQVSVPANTAWPLVSALGMSLAFSGFLTSWPIGAVGGILTMIGFVGWFKDCYPHDIEVELEVLPHHIPSEVISKREIDKDHPHHRAKLPLKIHRIRAGILGGIAGGIAMAIVAVIASYFLHGSLWHPFNMVAATIMPSITEGNLMHFHLDAFLVSIVIQLIAAICVGLVYGAVLPMMPKHPIILGAIIIPFTWSFLLYKSMAIVNPVFDSSVNWWWFLLSQFVFGLVAGLVVTKSERISTLQFKAFAERVGLEENKTK
jgi:hypothetical protein